MAAVLRANDGTEIPTSIRRVRLSPEKTGLSTTYYRYRADAVNLRPGETYTYQIFANGQEVTPVGNVFRTDDGNPFTFLAFGDSGMGTDGQVKIARRMNTESVSVALPLGDLAYPTGTYQQLEERYFNVYAPLMGRTPFFATPGNHDYYQEEAAPLLDSCVVPDDNVRAEDINRYYSFDWGPVHFVAIDSNTPLAACANGEEAMLRWLERDLSQTRKFWRIAYMHHPPYPSGAHEFEIEAERVRKYLVPIFEKYGVQLVLSGHEHSYQRSKPMREGAPLLNRKGIVYVVSGGAGAWLYEHTVRSHMDVGVTAFHYLLGEVDQGKLTMRAVAADGPDLDAFVMTPKPWLTGDVVNAASGSTGLAESGLASIFGHNLCFAEVRNPNPDSSSIRGTTVTLNDQPVRIIYASPDQLNVLLPEARTGEMSLTITTPNGVVTTNLVIDDCAPAIFSNGNGPLVFHADGVQATAERPVESGESIAIYVTGMGSQPGHVRVGFDGQIVVGEMERTEVPGVSLIRANAPWSIERAVMDLSVYASGKRSNVVNMPAVPVTVGSFD